MSLNDPFLIVSKIWKMENLEKGIEVSRLIVKDLQGCISPEEKVMLDKWLEESSENREIYHRVQGRVNREERQRIIRKLNKRAAWERVDRNTKKYRHPILRRCMKYAATIVLPLFMVGVGFYLIRDKEEIHPVAEMVKISPGVTKAELVLADGHKVVLGTETIDSLVSEEGVNIVKDGNGVSYLGNKEEGDLAYNIMRVPRGGEFKVRLQDGTLVYMNSETELKYPVRFVGKERRVYLSGEAYFEVQRDTTKPFIVVMNGNEVRVLGTEFNVRSYEDEKCQFTTLVAGKVLLTTHDHRCIELLPNEQGIVDPQGDIRKEQVDVALYTAWKDGNFVFRKQSLEHIMEIVERWYDLKVTFEDEWCKQVSFSGNVERYDDFSKLAEMLEATGSVKFRIKNNEIYVTKR
ncbi:FecR family protein [Butyricimonas virosa]|uniref:FecR family protein n=2 Tax=Butyricimonas virosa TaxID=544645 RepID=A0A412X1I3_9BACT|nr:FecR family protein [Butyricimonas virosa]